MTHIFGEVDVILLVRMEEIKEKEIKHKGSWEEITKQASGMRKGDACVTREYFKEKSE